MYVRSMVQRGVATELAGLPPGPQLAAALAGIDPHTLPDAELLGVLRAWSRQRAQAHARMLQTLTVVAEWSRAATRAAAKKLPRGVDAGEWAVAEIAAALTWTEPKASGELSFAETLLGRLPAVWAAFEAGRIDQGKA